MTAKLSSLAHPVPVNRETDRTEDVYDNGHLRVEHDNYYVACAGHPLKLPRAEFLIISRLARNPERIVSSEELWQHVWGDTRAFNTESLHVYIYRLRRKLEPHGIKIDTMVHVGYRLIPSVLNQA